MQGANLKHIAIALILAPGCSVPIDPKSYSYQKSVVIDGLITNEFAFHEISLTYSRPINEKEPEPISANVWVETSQGDIVDYYQKGNTYLPENPFAGEPFETYQLHFVMSNGKVYQSAEVMLIESPKIDSIYDRYEEIAPEGAVKNEGGIQFFLNTHDNSGLAKYFRYEWQEDYKIITPFTALDRYIYSENVIMPIDQPRNVCYATDHSSSVLIANTTETDGQVSEFPIRFVSGETDLLRNRYSINVKQYTISTEAYYYYRKFKQLNESTGSLFDRQQGALPGNVSSMDDPDEVVLGYFDVSGVTDMRVFFDYFDLDPKFPYPDYRRSCGPEDKYVPETPLSSFGVDINIIGYEPSAVIGPLPCSDCTNYGSIEPPTYWIE